MNVNDLLPLSNLPVAPSLATIISNIKDSCSHSNPIKVSCQLLRNIGFPPGWEANHADHVRGGCAVLFSYHCTRVTYRVHCVDTAAAIISLEFRTELLRLLNIYSYQ